MKLIRLALFSICLVLPLRAAAQDVTPQQRYDELVMKLKGGDTDIDYQALRYAYNETPLFSPFGAKNMKQEMFQALNAGEYERALSAATEALNADYTDIDAHFVSFAASDKLHDATRALFHRTVVRGLFQSIQKSGDGKTPETAYVVIRVPEEYSFIGLSGLQVEMQSLVQSATGPVDAMTVVDPATKEKQTIYFNVSRSFAAYERLLGGGTKPPAP